MLNIRNTIIMGDNLQILKQFEDECVDLIITSPPYFQQRDYGNGELGIGNEITENDYIQKMYILLPINTVTEILRFGTTTQHPLK